MKEVILFTSPRSSANNAAGLKLLQELSKKHKGGNDDVIVVLMQDAVLLALKDFSQSDFSETSEGYVLDEHLAKRGFTPQSLKSPFKPASYDEIVGLIMKDGTHVVGSF